MTPEAYARMQRALLPPSKFWRGLESVLTDVFLGAADELVRIDQRGLDLIEESDPRTTDELLPEFETMLALIAEGTEAERRARVQALLIRRQRYRPADFREALAPLLGQAPEDVVVLEQSRAFAVAVNDDSEIFRFYVYRDPELAGDYDLAAAQALVDSMAPSHTQGHVIESVSLLCDDEFSLCDRDRLGT